ncbi:MAG: hypothetical protein IKU15_00610 [Clostridia bacterium]|nr:hypothetical protein [Clostridia bacterium]MBR4889802.1 hypothetical protein [Clostridia bacterium]
MKTDIPSLDGYAKTEDIPDTSSFISMSDVEAKGYATETYVDEAIANIDIPEGGGGGIDTEAVQALIDDNIDELSFNNLFGASITTYLPALESYSVAAIEEAIKKGHIARNLSPLKATISLSNVLGKNYRNFSIYIGTVNSKGDITYTGVSAISTITIPGYAFAVKMNEQIILIADNQSYFVKALRKIAYDNSTSGLTATNIPAAIDELVEKINNLISSGNGGAIDLSNYYTKDETDAAIAQAQPDLTEYAKTADIPDTSNFITMQDVESKGYAKTTDIPSLDGYAKTADIPDVSSFVTEAEVNELIAAAMPASTEGVKF